MGGEMEGREEGREEGVQQNDSLSSVRSQARRPRPLPS